MSPEWDATGGSKCSRASTRRNDSSTGWHCRSKQTSRGLGAISSRFFGNTIPTLRLLALNHNGATAITPRQLRAAEVGDALRALSDPAWQTWLDPVPVISRH